MASAAPDASSPAHVPGVFRILAGRNQPAPRRRADQRRRSPRSSRNLALDRQESRQERMPPCEEPAGHANCWITPLLLLVRAIINDMAYCDLCEMDRGFCEHGLTERRRNAVAIADGLLISPNGIVHIPGCHHKGDDPDYSRWAMLDTPRAWERLGNGEQLPATGGQSPGLIAGTRCQDCASHGPW